MTGLTERHALIGVGGNLGAESEILDRFLAAERALLTRLNGRGAAVSSRWSPMYSSAPEGPVRDQPRFVNAVLAIEADVPLEPYTLLADLLAIEAKLGRSRPPALAKGPRTIDLDLLFVGDARIDGAGPPALCLPHPLLSERAFVLMPLADLMGDAWHMPGFACTVADCLADPDVARQVPSVTHMPWPAPVRAAFSPAARLFRRL